MPLIANASIRIRLTLWYSAVLLLGLVIFGAAIRLVLESRLVAGVDARLMQKIAGLKTLVETEGHGSDTHLEEELTEVAAATPDGSLLELVRSPHTLLLPSSAEPAFPVSMLSAPGGRDMDLGGQSYRVVTSTFAIQGANYTALAATSLQDVRQVAGELNRLMLFIAPLVLLAACLGGYWISRRALSPVDGMTTAAQSISGQDLSRRLPVPRTGDELERLAIAWNGLLERVEASIGRIQQFTANASHELRTPVSVIRSTAELALRRERDVGEYRRALNEIEQEARGMTALTESLLTLARADAGSGLPLGPVNLNALVEEVRSQNLSRADSRQIQLEVFAPSPPLILSANDVALRRLLFILIDNALKYTPVGGRVVVSTAVRDGFVTLSVRDSGPGIPPDALPHIFDRFYRGDEAGNGDGVGLGLSIARSIARAHGSEIEVESRPGEGSCFRLTLKC